MEDASGGRMYQANTGRAFNDLDSMLAVQEGWHDPQRNPTDHKGIPTIGRGTNRTFLHPEEKKYLQSRRGGAPVGQYVPDDLSPQESQWFYENRRNRAAGEAAKAVGQENWGRMSGARQAALTSLFYSTGPSAASWDITMGAVRDGRWDDAAQAIRQNQQYVSDVGPRAEEIAQLLEEGRFPGQPEQQVVEAELPDGRLVQIEVPADWTPDQIGDEVDAVINQIKLQENPQDPEARAKAVTAAMDNTKRREIERQAEAAFRQKVAVGAANDDLGDVIAHGLQVAAEANLMLGTGVLGYVGSGIAGLAGLTTALLTGEAPKGKRFEKAMDVASLWQEGFMNAMTYEPKSDAMINIMMTAAPTLAALDEAVTDFWDRESVNPNTGEQSVLVATVGKTVMYGMLDIAGLGAAWRAGNVGAARRALRQVRKQAKEMELSLKQEGLADSLVRYVQRELTDPSTGQIREGASTIEPLIDEILDAHKVARQTKRQLWDDMNLEQNREFISAPAIERFARSLERAVVDSGQRADTPKVSAILDDLEQIRTKKPGMRQPRPNTGTGGSIGAAPMKGTVMDVDMRDLVLLRKQINSGISTYANQPEDAALITMRRELDNWIRREFDHIARTGNRQALEAWEEARAFSHEYNKLFNVDNTIKRMIEMDASPEEVKNWIFGAAALGSKKQAITTVRRMKDILGADSPAIKQLQFESKVDLLSPILNEQPGWNQFINQWRKMKRTVPGLIRELDIDRNLMDQLERYAHVARRLPPRDHRPFLLRWMTRFFATHILGHQLATKAMHVQTARGILDSMLGSEKLSPAQVTKRIAQQVYEESLPIAQRMEVPRQAFMKQQPRTKRLFKDLGPVWNEIQIRAALPQALLENEGLSGRKQEQDRRTEAVREYARKRREQQGLETDNAP